MEKFDLETKTVAVHTPQYQKARDFLVTQQTTRKMNHTSKEIKWHPKKGIHGMENLCTEYIQTSNMGPNRKIKYQKITAGITGKYENQPHVQLVILNKDTTESREYNIL